MQDNFKITRVKREAAFEMQNEHYHSFYEFYYLVSGDRKLFLNGKNYRVKSGDIMLIPKREIHRTTFFGEGSEHERIAMCFSDEVIEHLQKSIGQEVFEQCFCQRQLSIPIEKREYLENMFDKLLKEYQGQDEFSSILCQMYCEEIILFIIRLNALVSQSCFCSSVSIFSFSINSESKLIIIEPTTSLHSKTYL